MPLRFEKHEAMKFFGSLGGGEEGEFEKKEGESVRYEGNWEGRALGSFILHNTKSL